MVDLTLDSSETIMFTKGGKHKINLNAKDLIFNDGNDFDFEEGEDVKRYAEIEISIQMDGSDKARYDFINEEAKKHRQRADEIK